MKEHPLENNYYKSPICSDCGLTFQQFKYYMYHIENTGHMKHKYQDKTLHINTFFNSSNNLNHGSTYCSNTNILKNTYVKPHGNQSPYYSLNTLEHSNPSSSAVSHHAYMRNHEFNNRINYNSKSFQKSDGEVYQLFTNADDNKSTISMLSSEVSSSASDPIDNAFINVSNVSTSSLLSSNYNSSNKLSFTIPQKNSKCGNSIITYTDTRNQNANTSVPIMQAPRQSMLPLLPLRYTLRFGVPDNSREALGQFLQAEGGRPIYAWWLNDSSIVGDELIANSVEVYQGSPFPYVILLELESLTSALKYCHAFDILSLRICGTSELVMSYIKGDQPHYFDTVYPTVKDKVETAIALLNDLIYYELELIRADDLLS